MSIIDDKEVEVDYEFHNNAAFVQIELGLEEVDVEEVQGLSEIRPMLQALNSPNMWSRLLALLTLCKCWL